MPELGCKNCGNCTWFDGIGAVERVCVDCKFDENGHPTNWRPRKTETNADHIRAMSDEELADLLGSVRNDEYGIKVIAGRWVLDIDICEWLRRPWEEA